MEVNIQNVLLAIEVMFNNNQSTSEQRKEANKWLEQYQKTSAAWSITDSLIRMPSSSMEAKVFAAQTFRQKIEYDIMDLDEPSMGSLRDSLVGLCLDYYQHNNLGTQLCIALADLAIIMTTWNGSVSLMVETFGKTNETMPILLKFLTVLPEELIYNTKISLDRDEFEDRKESLLKNNANLVLQILFSSLKNNQLGASRLQILECLSSWIRSGCINAQSIRECQLVPLAFETLQSQETFDVGADMVCEIIAVSAREPRNDALVQDLCPFLNNLVPFLMQNLEDPDISRGICRIFVEAGEGYCLNLRRYKDLIAQNLATFESLVRGLLACMSCEEVEVVKITINFWFVLSEQIFDKPELIAQFVPVYENLASLILKQLRYPKDYDTFTAQDRDDFKDFRHDIGDVLKDCVRVLGEERALAIPYNQLQPFFHYQGDLSASWEEIEAPLFSLRTMCREISPGETKYIPEIMQMLPKLPHHPKVKYAAILVIGRYAQWTNNHTDLIEFQLDFVCKGFADSPETTIAAAHAFRDLCKYCNKHLVNYFEHLQPFYDRTIQTVELNDQRELSEAISHLISAVPLENASQALSMYCLPVAKKLNDLVEQPGIENDKESIKSLNMTLDQLGTLLQFIDFNLGPGDTHPTVQFLSQMWPMFETLFAKHGHRSSTSECLSKFFRHVLDSTQLSFQPLLGPLMTLVVQAFEQKRFSSYIWLCTKCVRVFGVNVDYQNNVCQLIERITQSVFQTVQERNSKFEEPDLVIEEYHYLLSVFMDACPLVYLNSPILKSTFQCAIYCLTESSEPAAMSVLRYMTDLFDLARPQKSKIAVTAIPIILPLAEQFGLSLTQNLFKAMIYSFSRERALITDVAELILSISSVIGAANMFQMAKSVVDSFPEKEMSNELKSTFLGKLSK